MAFSYAYTTGSGVTNAVAVPFPYMDQLHVHVYVDGVEVSADTLTWETTGIIRLPLSASNYTGKRLLVRRITPVGTPVVEFSNGRLDYADLNSQGLQLLYATQEAADQAAGAFRVPLHEAGSAQLEVAEKDDRRGTFFTFDSNGDPSNTPLSALTGSIDWTVRSYGSVVETASGTRSYGSVTESTD